MKRWLVAHSGVFTVLLMLAGAQYMQWIDDAMAATLLAVFAWMDAIEAKSRLKRLESKKCITKSC